MPSSIHTFHARFNVVARQGLSLFTPVGVKLVNWITPSAVIDSARIFSPSPCMTIFQPFEPSGTLVSFEMVVTSIRSASVIGVQPGESYDLVVRRVNGW